jgi:YfiH family protein
MFISSPLLSEIPSISHGFFTRNGGVSEGTYQSLNCGWGSNDNLAHVEENRRRVSKSLGALPKNLCSLYQIHSADVVNVTSPWTRESMPQADAMVTNKPGIALGILTADCVPVLFADSKNNVIGAAHSGWKGAFAGILQNTVNAMIALGADFNHITASIGPAISKDSYEVGVEFYQNFWGKSADYRKYFSPSREAHYFFNIKGFVKDMLLETGIQAVNTLENDTYIEEDNFFSYRRNTHKGISDYGRQISAIMLKP